MTHWMTTLSNSKDAVMIIFDALALFAVVGLEAFRKWLDHAPREEHGGRANAVAAIVAAVFLAKRMLGGAGMAAEGKSFIDLSLALFGLAGVIVISSLMWRYHHGLPLDDDEDAERRHMMARDL